MLRGMLGRSIDQQLRIADIGSGNLAVGILHLRVRLSVPDHVTYLGIRPDPARALPAGYVNSAID